MSDFATEYSDLHDMFLHQAFVTGRRGVGMSTVLREIIHVLHLGQAVIAVPNYHMGYDWVSKYRDRYPNDAVPTIIIPGRSEYLRGLNRQKNPLYVECWNMLPIFFQEECRIYGIVNAVSTHN